MNDKYAFEDELEKRIEVFSNSIIPDNEDEKNKLKEVFYRVLYPAIIDYIIKMQTPKPRFPKGSDYGSNGLAIVGRVFIVLF